MSEIDLSFLRQVPLFRRLGTDELAAVAHAMRPVDVRSGKILFEQGEASDGAYVIKSGRLAVELPLPAGQIRSVARLGEGTVVGEICLIEPAPRTLRVRALTDASLYFIDRTRFNTLRARKDTGAYKLIRNISLTLSQRLRETNVRIQEHWQGKGRDMIESTVTGLSTKPQSAWSKLRALFGRA